MAYNVISVGNITLDQLSYVEKFPKIDDVEVVQKTTLSLGGRGGLVAMILNSLGCRAALCTTVDEAGSAEIKRHTSENSDIGGPLLTVVQGSLGLFQISIYIGNAERNCISFFFPKNIDFVVTEEQREAVKAARVVYFSTHKRAFNFELLSLLDSTATVVVHNMDRYLISNDAYLQLMLAKSRILIGNEAEAENLLSRAGVKTPFELMQSNSSIELMVVTRGECGSIAYLRGESKETIEIPAEPVDVLTPVGAGDAYVAGFIYGIHCGWNVISCLKFATLVAAESVKSAYSYPTRKALHDCLNEFSSKMMV